MDIRRGSPPISVSCNRRNLYVLTELGEEWMTIRVSCLLRDLQMGNREGVGMLRNFFSMVSVSRIEMSNARNCHLRSRCAA